MATIDLLTLSFSVPATPATRPVVQVYDSGTPKKITPKIRSSGSTVEPQVKVFIDGEWVEIIKPAP